MIRRYEHQVITNIFSDANRVLVWQKVELAVTKALELQGKAPEGVTDKMTSLLANPVDLEEWYRLERINHHDLNAFLEERIRFLPVEVQKYWHPGTTSYDTEEPAFALMLREAEGVVRGLAIEFNQQLRRLAQVYRYTPMYARTHGQGAKMQTFGKRCLTYRAEFGQVFRCLMQSSGILRYSKLSGAIGSYGGRLSPELEKTALEQLNLQPFYGATQIMPRSFFVPLATQLALLVSVVQRVALDLRLAARSGRTLYQEPFAKKQKGSSAMPHKKNTTVSEKAKGMARLADSYVSAIRDNAETWEERAIEQSSVERVAWPDLFHVTCHALTSMTKILSGLRVNPDQMAKELFEARKCYASDEAKEELKEMGSSLGLAGEEAYRMVQLGCFNVFEVSPEARLLCESPPRSYAEALQVFPEMPYDTLEDIIREGRLRVSEELELSRQGEPETPEQKVQRWNELLRKIFSDPANLEKWRTTFTAEYLLQHESFLYQQILRA